MSNVPNAEQALKDLLQRNERYVADKRNGTLQDSARRESLIGGQSPFAIVLSCADSRVVPELVFDAGLGELFVIRVAGNVANTSSLASIEYAVAHLGVKLVLVLGHQSCGAVTAAIGGGDAGPNLNHLLALIKPAIDACDSSEVDAVVKQNARTTGAALLEKSQILRDAQGLKIVPAFYSLKSGKVEVLD